MKLKILLIIMVSLSYLGGISSAIFLYKEKNDSKILLMGIGIITINILCAKYLYNKTNRRRVEWALFGLLANINAIIIYWFCNLLLNKWKKKETLLK